LLAAHKLWSHENQQGVKKKTTRKWALISETLPGRSQKAVQEHYYVLVTMANEPEVSDSWNKGWSEKEDRLVMEGHTLHGSDWAATAMMLPGRKESAVKARYYSVLGKWASVIEAVPTAAGSRAAAAVRVYSATAAATGATAATAAAASTARVPQALSRHHISWSAKEDRELLEGQSLHGNDRAAIAEMLPGRTETAVQAHYYNVLAPEDSKRSSKTWSEEEDRMLLKGHTLHCTDWAAIAERLPGRTDVAVRVHYTTVLAKRADMLDAVTTAAGSGAELVHYAADTSASRRGRKAAPPPASPTAPPPALASSLPPEAEEAEEEDESHKRKTLAAATPTSTSPPAAPATAPAAAATAAAAPAAAFAPAPAAAAPASTAQVTWSEAGGPFRTNTRPTLNLHVPLRASV
jgi:hypothetical protein